MKIKHKMFGNVLINSIMIISLIFIIVYLENRIFMASKQKLYNECYKSISLVLNADRDFYQAYLAKVKYGSSKSESDKKDYEENVKQVLLS